MHKGHLVLGGIVGITLLSGAALLSTGVSADDVIDQINITVPESCSVEGTIASGGEHTKTVQNNNYYSEIGTTTFKTYCNDNNGYAIYAIGYSNDEFGNTLMKHNSNSTYDFDTGTATSGSTSNWAMMLTAAPGTYAPTIHSDTNGAFTSYHVIPSTYTKVVSFASNTDLPATGVNATGSGFTSTYASWISATQPAGTYTGKVIYTLVHPASEEIPLQPVDCPSGKICYSPNGSNVIGTMGQPSISSSATSATLLASNYSREGFGFAGWSDVYDYATNSNAHFFGPQEDITFTAKQYSSPNPGLSLYAVWVKSTGSIQSWSGCNSLADGAITALTDQRDGETYAVAKLADGKCWMIENLRLESDASHNSDGTLSQGYGTSTTYGNFSGLANPETQDKFTTTYSANSLYSNDGNNGTINIGASYYPAYRMPRYNNVNTPTTNSDRPQYPKANEAANSTSNSGLYSYGNYYTWHAAVANLTPNYTNNQSTTNTSLCPTGWRLPVGGRKANVSISDYWKLSRAIIGSNPANYAEDMFYYTGNNEGINASKAMRAYPNNFVYPGGVYGGSIYFRGSVGRYWSSTVFGSYNAYNLLLEKDTVFPGTSNDSDNKYFGGSIRCLTSSS